MNDLPLGRSVVSPTEYSPQSLAAVPRSLGRHTFANDQQIQFVQGWDRWTAWEYCWVDQSGRLVPGVLEILVPWSSPNIVESKSLKLYLNSVYYTQFASQTAMLHELKKQLAQCLGKPPELSFFSMDRALAEFPLASLSGVDLDAAIPATQTEEVALRRYYTHAFRSLCPVTGQPDWASLIVDCESGPLDVRALSAYFRSFSEHQGFHESCVEAIYFALKARYGLERLSVTARYTRRGGIDINPFRASCETMEEPKTRVVRQ